MNPTAPPDAPEQPAAWLDDRIDRLTFHRGPVAELPRIERVVATLERAPEGRHVLPWAQELVPLFAPEFLLIHAEPIPSGMAYSPVRHDPAANDASAVALLDPAAAALKAAGATAVETALREGAPLEGIRSAIERSDADLVVTGAPPESAVERFLLGSVPEGVLTDVRGSILFAKRAPLPGDVLCAVDGSAESRRAAALALEIARRWGSQLRLLHVREPEARRPVEGEDSILLGLRNRLGLPWTDVRDVDFELEMGKPRDVLLARVEQTRPALVVAGTRGLGGVRAFFLGSVGTHLAHHAPTNVLLVGGAGATPRP